MSPEPAATFAEIEAMTMRALETLVLEIDATILRAFYPSGVLGYPCMEWGGPRTATS